MIIVLIGDVDSLKRNIAFCRNCKRGVMQRALSETESIDLEEARRVCANCKYRNQGIYKFDAIYEFMRTCKLTPGKKPVVERKHGETIRELREQGETIRAIAKNLGLSKTTVHKVLKHQEAVKQLKE